jgi:hypothetical protein
VKWAGGVTLSRKYALSHDSPWLPTRNSAFLPGCVASSAKITNISQVSKNEKSSASSKSLKSLMEMGNQESPLEIPVISHIWLLLFLVLSPETSLSHK